jgi:hypothetical protein
LRRRTACLGRRRRPAMVNCPSTSVVTALRVRAAWWTCTRDTSVARCFWPSRMAILRGRS